MSLQPPSSRPSRPDARLERFAALSLQNPTTLARYDTYEQAQKAVDTLSDAAFPVENCLIVGTDLRQLERVTGRLTWGRVLAGGALSGVWMGVFVGWVLVAVSGAPLAATFLMTVVAGAFFGLVWAGLGYAMTGGRRDFSSVTQIVPSTFELLCEQEVAGRARELLREHGMSTLPDPARPTSSAPAPLTDPDGSPRYGYNPPAAERATGADSDNLGA